MDNLITMMKLYFFILRHESINIQNYKPDMGPYARHVSNNWNSFSKNNNWDHWPVEQVFLSVSFYKRAHSTLRQLRFR